MRLRCNKLFETAFYSLSVKTFAYHL